MDFLAWYYLLGRLLWGTPDDVGPLCAEWSGKSGASCR